MRNLSLIVFALLCCVFVAKTFAQDQDYIDLLKKRVAVAKVKFMEVDAASKMGMPSGSAPKNAESRIALATAEAALYQHIGDRENLLAALERKREAAKSLVQATNAMYQAGTGSYTQFAEAELALAEAEYELKKTQRDPVTVSPVIDYRGEMKKKWRLRPIGRSS